MRLDAIHSPIAAIPARYRAFPARLQVIMPVVRPRSSSTPWYSGVTPITNRSTAGYDSGGANVPENRNSANCATER